MLLAYDLHVDVLVVVFVQRGDGVRVADPEVDGFGGFLERDSRKGDAGIYVCEEF